MELKIEEKNIKIAKEFSKVGVFEAIHDLHARSQVSRGGHIFSEKELRITEGRKMMKIQGPGKLVNICSN